MAMIELKPCPFCGGTPVLIEHKYDLSHILYGYDCYGDDHHTCGVGYFETQKEAVEAWNRRANDA